MLVGTRRLVDRFSWTLQYGTKAWVYMSATLSLQELTSIRNDWSMGANPLSDAVATSMARQVRRPARSEKCLKLQHCCGRAASMAVVGFEGAECRQVLWCLRLWVFSRQN